MNKNRIYSIVVGVYVLLSITVGIISFNTYRQELKTAQQDVKEYEEKINELESKEHNWQKSIGTVESENKKLNEENKNVRLALNSRLTEIHKLKQEVKSLEKKYEKEYKKKKAFKKCLEGIRPILHELKVSDRERAMKIPEEVIFDSCKEASSLSL